MVIQAAGSIGRIVIDTETTYNVPKTTGKTGKIIPFNTCDLAFTRAMNSSAAIRANRNPSIPIVGYKSVGGNLVVPVLADAFGWMLRLMFGAPATTGSTGAYSHVFKIGAVTALPSFIVETGLNYGTAFYEVFSGCKMNSMGLTVGGDGELLATFGIMGAESNSPGGSTKYDSSEAAVGGTKFLMQHATATEGGSSVTNLQNLVLNINNNLDGDTHCIGDAGSRLDMPEGVVAVNGNIKALFNGVGLLTKATGDTESSLAVDFNPSGTTDNLVVAINELVYSPNSPKIDGPKGVTLDLNFEGYYSNHGDASALTITLVNPTSTYAL